MTDLNPVPMEDRLIVRNTDPVEHKLLIEPSPRWVRAVFNNVVVASSKRVLLLDETRHMPVYYFPIEDVRMDLMEPGTVSKEDEHKGPTTPHTVVVNGKRAENAGWTHESPVNPAAEGLRGYMAFYWHKMDHWYEEDDEVYVHPRDPRHRVDVCNSSRHVKVIVDGQVVAKSRRPRILFETNLPTRYYLPAADVQLDLLYDSPTTSQCPYKGIASYYHVRSGDMLAKDLAWYYRFPLPESSKIENLICFFNERVDAIEVDGVELEKPRTPWTKKPTMVPLPE